MTGLSAAADAEYEELQRQADEQFHDSLRRALWGAEDQALDAPATRSAP